MQTQHKSAQLGRAWLLLCAALALHVTDEALTGFLSVYNPTVLAVRERLSWFPMPTFGFREWLTGLICAVVILILLAPLFYRGAGWIRPMGYFAAVVNVLNACGHIMATILGRTVAAVHFSRPAPGFYSSLLLLPASVYLLVELRRTAHQGAIQAARA